MSMVVEALDEAGIDCAIWQGEYLVHMANCVMRNTHALQAMRNHRERVRSFAIVQPDHPDALDEIARCVDAGMCGVGELNPVAQHFSLRSSAFLRCAEYCATHALPMLFHVNEPVGEAYPGKVNNALSDYYELAARIPELRIVLAHWGGGLWFYEQMPSVRRVLSNVYYDTAASWLTYPDTSTMVRMAMSVIPHKVVFGSDFPLKKPSAAMPQLAAWLHEVTNALPDSTRDAVRGDTAHLLLSQTAPVHSMTPRGVTTIDLRTSVVGIVESYPAADAVLQRWGITVTAATPWWQSIAHAAVSAGYHPQTHAQLLADILEVVTID